MRGAGFSFAGLGLRTAGLFAAIVLPVVLSGCASSSGSSGGGGLGEMIFGTSASPSGGKTVNDSEYPPGYFTKDTYCPPVVIKPGTEAVTHYQRGHESDAQFITTQASITRTARECHLEAGTLTMKIGVGGRLIAGPKGKAGTVTLPIRVAITHQNKDGVLFSKLLKVPVTLSAPDLSGDFSQVLDKAAVPLGAEDHDLIIYVGFDEGKTS